MVCAALRGDRKECPDGSLFLHPHFDFGRVNVVNKLIEVGKIVNTHGLKGEVKVNPWTDSPEVFESFENLYVSPEKCYPIVSVRYQKSCVLVKLSGVDSIEDAEKLKNRVVYTDRDIFEDLPDGVYLVSDIIGLEVFEDGRLLGKVADVLNTGSNDVYVVRRGGARDLLVPAIKDVVSEINIADGRIDVILPKGLSDGDEA